MKNTIYFLFSCFFIISCGKNEDKKSEDTTAEVATIEKGQLLFEQNNCVACHKVDQKIVGPSLQETAKIYKEKNGDLVAFLKEEAEPLVDDKMYETMKINLQITKTMSDTELESLEMYILSHTK
ncbi:MAG: c-type cytochrome [Bacteroidota bacterium]